MTQPALLGGLFIGVLSALPVVSVGNVCCCLWIIGGGFLAAYVDSNNTGRTITVSRGAFDGLAAGIVGAFVWMVMAALVSAVLSPLQERLAEEMLRRASEMPPELRAWFETLGGEPSPWRFAVGFVFQLLVGAIFAPLGGMLGAMYFRKDVPPALGGTYVPPLPPEQ